jgi:hypothetical protein
MQCSARFVSAHRRFAAWHAPWKKTDYSRPTLTHVPVMIDRLSYSETIRVLRQFYQPALSPIPTPHTFTALRPYLQTLPPIQRQLLATYHQSANDLQIWRALRSRKSLTIAYDGGLKNTNGTYGWKIVDRSNMSLFSGAGPGVDGDYSSASSTRSELYGVAAPVVLIASLRHFWGTMHRAQYSWLCDSKSALKQVLHLQYHETRKRRQPNNVDILSLFAQHLPLLAPN